MLLFTGYPVGPTRYQYCINSNYTYRNASYTAHLSVGCTGKFQAIAFQVVPGTEKYWNTIMEYLYYQVT